MKPHRQLLMVSRAGKMAVARFSEADDHVDDARYESSKVMREVIAPNLSCPSCGYFFKGECEN